MRVKELNKDIVKAIRITTKQLPCPTKYKLYGCEEGQRFLKKLKKIINSLGSRDKNNLCNKIDEFVNKKSDRISNRYEIGSFAKNLYPKEGSIIEMVINIYISYVYYIENCNIKNAHEFIDELLIVLKGMREENYNYNVEEQEVIIKSIRENDGLNQEDLDTLKEIADLDMMSEEYKSLIQTAYKYVDSDYDYFTRFLEEDLVGYDEWITMLRKSGDYDEDIEQCKKRLQKDGYEEDIQKMSTDNFMWFDKLTEHYDQTGNSHCLLDEEYSYICNLENTINLVKSLNSNSVDNIVEIYRHYYYVNYRYQVDSKNIMDFVGYIAENLLDEDLSPIEIEEEVEGVV